MRQKRGPFFFAVLVFTAAPAFADRIPVNLIDGDTSFVSMQRLPNKNALQDVSDPRNFALSTFKEDYFRLESNAAARMSGFSKDGKISDLGALLNSGPGLNNRQANLFDLSFKHGDSFRWDDKKARGKDNEGDRDGDGFLSVVAVPEPGSRTLFLVGFAVLAMIVYRRNAPKHAF